MKILGSSFGGAHGVIWDLEITQGLPSTGSIDIVSLHKLNTTTLLFLLSKTRKTAKFVILNVFT